MEHQERPSHTDEDPESLPIPAKKLCVLVVLLGKSYSNVAAPPKSFSAIAEKGVRKYTEAAPLALTEDPLSWWKIHKQVFSSLAKLAKRYLCIPGTSVLAEQVFSTAGDIVTVNT